MINSLFKIRDRIQVKENQFKGTIVSVSEVDSYRGKLIEYSILWDNFSHKACEYLEEDIKDVWELEPLNNTAYVKLAKAIDFVPISVEIDKAKTCNHNFVPYYGLKDSFEFCTRCDEKKK